MAQRCVFINVLHMHHTHRTTPPSTTTQEERAQQVSQNLRAGQFDVCVTTYEIVIKEFAAFRVSVALHQLNFLI